MTRIGLKIDGLVRREPRGQRYLCVPVLLALAAAGICLAESGRGVAVPLPTSRTLERAGWTIADFDGDSRPDVAISKSEPRGAGYVYWLELDLSTKRAESSYHSNSIPAVNSIFGLHLTPRDVDGDHNLDIVVTSGIALQPVAVWINDGQGRFEEGDPAAYPAWIWREGFSVTRQGRQEKEEQLFYDQERRSRSGLLLSPSPYRPFLPSGIGRTGHTESQVSHSSFDQLAARAPPCRPSSVS